MNYKQTLNYLYEQLPMFHRIGPAAYKANLDNTLAICKHLKHPEKKFKSVHVAGTNGKGSTSHMLAAVLQACGYKTGLYTSPHLVDFRERIRINGKMIPQKKIVDFVEKHKTVFEKIKPSFFEWTVGLAFDYFAKEKVDIAIIETGLGGRLDSTNVISPLVSIITNIGYDHTNLLGDTLEKIAGEKAGIIKKNVPVIISERQKETEKIFQKKAKKENAPVFFAQEEFLAYFHTLRDLQGEISVIQKSSGDFNVYSLDLPGNYQMKNLPGVLMCLELLKKKRFKITKEKTLSALKNVKRLTGLRGRFEILQKNPMIICDTGHNAEGIKEVLEMIRTLKFKKLHFVFGVVNDKDPSAILKLLPKEKTKYYFTKADIPRALNARELKKIATKNGLKGNSFDTVAGALIAARSSAKNDDLIFIGGSTFVVGDALKGK
jgi:dihydrofolate synthase / folylpolyglutamate synthase